MDSVKTFTDLFEICRRALPRSLAHRNPVPVLAVLTSVANNSAISQDQRRRVTGIAKGEVSKLVTALTSLGWIEKTGGQRNNEATSLVITPAGSEFLATLRQKMDSHLNIAGAPTVNEAPGKFAGDHQPNREVSADPMQARCRRLENLTSNDCVSTPSARRIHVRSLQVSGPSPNGLTFSARLDKRSLLRGFITGGQNLLDTQLSIDGKP